MSAQIVALNYSGRISNQGRPFTGVGFFVFSIQETNGVIWWRSGELPYEGSTNLPPGAVKLAVKEDTYQTWLGDATPGMMPLELSTLHRAISPWLRVWFKAAEGTNGWRRASDDVLLADTLTELGPKSTPITSAQAESLLAEIRQLHALLQPPAQIAAPVVVAEPPPTPTATVSIKNYPSIGRAEAPVVLVEFIDFECPYCKEAFETSLAGLRKKYIETGKLRLVSRNLILKFHAQAEPAARAVVCAAQQDKFWPMHDRLFGIAPALSTSNLIQAAEELKLDVPVFCQCLEEASSGERIKAEAREAAAAGIHGTPTFVLGKASGEQVTGEMLAGVQTFAFLDREIQKLLAP